MLKDSNLRTVSHRRFSGPISSTTRTSKQMAQRVRFELTCRDFRDGSLASCCPTVRRPLHNAPFSHRCLYDPWQTRTADSSLRGWRLRPTCRRGLMVCRVGFEPTNCNRPVLQTVCFDRLHTGTYKEALSLVVLPAGFEPSKRCGLSALCLPISPEELMAGVAGFEPATNGLTVRRSAY